MLDCMRGETYSSFCHMYALADVVCCNIRSVYPESKKTLCQTKWLKCSNFSSGKNWKHGVDIMVIYSRYGFRKRLAAKPFCSFIPEWLICVKLNETQPIRRKCDITNFFAEIPSSKSIEKKAEVTQVPPPKRNKKEKKREKRGGKERPKKRKIKRTIITLENLKGLLRIVASLIKICQRKILAFSQS